MCGGGWGANAFIASAITPALKSGVLCLSEQAQARVSSDLRQAAKSTHGLQDWRIFLTAQLAYSSAARGDAHRLVVVRLECSARLARLGPLERPIFGDLASHLDAA